MAFSYEQIQESMKTVSREDAKEFFAERVKNSQCPACSTNEWGFVGTEDSVVVFPVQTKTGEFALPPPTIPLINVACHNCGYVRSHVVGIIALWKLYKSEGQL